MPLSSPCILFFLHLCLVVAAAAADSGGDTRHVKEVCKAAGNAASLCERSLLTYPESRTADARQLAALSIRYAADAAADAATAAARTADRVGHRDNKLEECLKDCSDHLMDAVENLDDSTAAIDDYKHGDVSTFLSAAMSDATSCNEGCEDVERGVETAAMRRMSDEVFDLCGIAMALTNQLN